MFIHIFFKKKETTFKFIWTKKNSLRCSQNKLHKILQTYIQCVKRVLNLSRWNIRKIAHKSSNSALQKLLLQPSNAKPSSVQKRGYSLRKEFHYIKNNPVMTSWEPITKFQPFSVNSITILHFTYKIIK